MSRAATRPANPAPAAHSTNRDPDTPAISFPRYSFSRPFPTLPEKWRSPLDQDKLLNEYLSHDGYFGTFAASRGLTVDQLYDWLHSDEVAARRKRMAEMAQERTDLLARLARPAAIQALLHLITHGCMNHNQTRLAASALLRAAESAERRAERAASAVPARMSVAHTPPASSPSDVSMCQCENVSPLPSSPAGGGAAVLRGGGGSVSTSSTTPPSHDSAPPKHGPRALSLARAGSARSCPIASPTPSRRRSPNGPSTQANSPVTRLLPPTPSPRILARIGPSSGSPAPGVT